MYWKWEELLCEGRGCLQGGANAIKGGDSVLLFAESAPQCFNIKGSGYANKGAKIRNFLADL